MNTTIISRVGRKPIVLPAGVNVTVQGLSVSVKGPKGNLELSLHPYIELLFEEDQIKINEAKNKTYVRKGSGRKLVNSAPGTTRANLQNAILGVTKGFERRLELVGVGYRAQMKGKVLNLALGYSHAIDYTPPEGVAIEAPSVTQVIVKGINKQLVGQVAAIIRAFRSPEPYNGKGVRYADEKVVRKETKKK